MLARIRRAGLCLMGAALGFAVWPARAAASGPAAYFSGAVVFANASTQPAGVARDAQGNLYVADAVGGQVVKQSPAGVRTVVASGLSFNLGDSAGLAVDSAGNVYIGTSSAVLKETLANGAYTQTSIATGYVASGLAVDASGNVFAASHSGSGQIVKYTLSGGSYTPSVVESGTSAFAVAVDGAGAIYAAEMGFGGLVKWTPGPGGTYSSTTLDNTIFPNAVAVDAAGNVYATDTSYGSVVKETLTGGAYTATTIADLDHNGIESPTSLALDAAGDVFIADGVDDSVLELPAAGVDFGSSRVGAAGASLTLRFTAASFPVTLGAPVALTDGVAGADFSASAGGCTGILGADQSCTVTAVWTPAAAGTRYGAIELVDSGGNLLATAPVWGTGTGAQIAFGPGAATTFGAVTSPTQAAVDGAGDVFWVDGTAGALEEKPAGGAYTQAALGSGLSTPQGVAVDGAGNVYISDSGNGRILEETPTGGGYTQSVLITGLSSPGAIAVDGGGNIYVALGAGRIVRETLLFGAYVQSNVAALVAPLPLGSGLAVTSGGTVFAYDPGNKAVLQATLNNGVYSTVLLGTYPNPVGLALDSSDNLYVSDPVSGQLTMLSAASGYAAASTLGASKSAAVAVDASRGLFFQSASGGTMTHLDRRAAPSLDFGARALGSVNTQSFSINNLGTAALNITAVSPPGSGFAASGCAVGPLAAGSACTEAVKFSPQVLGAVSSQLSFADDNLAAISAQQTIALTGSGTAAALTITASSATIRLGDAIPAITPSYAGFVNGDTAASLTTAPACSTTATISSPVGTYASSCAGAADTNYTIAYVAGTVTITNGTPQTITFAPLAPIAYGSAALPLTATSTSGLAPTFQLISGPATLTGSTLSITGAGSVVIEADQAGDGTYSAATPVRQTLTVTPAPLTITASSATVKVGNAIPAITPAYSGFVNGDTAAALTTAPTCTTTATSSSPAGTYPATCGGAAGANYSIGYAAGTITITAGTAQTVTFAPIGGLTYGSAPITLSATSSSGLAPAFQLVSGPATLAGSNLTITGAGTVIVEAVQAGDATYAAAPTVSQTVTVAPASLIVTASTASVRYGSVIAAITPAYTGFVNGDAAAVLTSAPTCTTTAAIGDSVGTYATNCTGAAAANYHLAYVPGTLTITPAPLSITASSASIIYGSAPPAIFPIFSGFVGGDGLASLTTQPVCTTTASATSIAAFYPYPSTCGGAVDPNYAISYVAGGVTIRPANVTLTLTNVPATVAANQTFAVTAQVLSSTVGTPTGSVTFNEIVNNVTTVIGAGTLSGGTVQVSLGMPVAGAAQLQAQYSGENNFNTASSVSAMTVTAAGRQGFDLTVPTTGGSVSPYGAGAADITATAFGGYEATVTFSCPVLPTYLTCVFSPAFGTMNGLVPSVKSTLQVEFAENQNSAAPPGGDHPGQRWRWVVLGLMAGWLLGLRLLKRRKQRLAWSMVIAAIAVSACSFMVPPTHVAIPVQAHAVSTSKAGGGTDQTVTKSVDFTVY